MSPAKHVEPMATRSNTPVLVLALAVVVLAACSGHDTGGLAAYVPPLTDKSAQLMVQVLGRDPSSDLGWLCTARPGGHAWAVMQPGAARQT